MAELKAGEPRGVGDERCVHGTNPPFACALGCRDELLRAEIADLRAKLEAERAEAEHYRIEASNAYLAVEHAQERMRRLEEALVTAVEIVHELGHAKVPFAACTASRCTDARAYADGQNPPSLPEMP